MPDLSTLDSTAPADTDLASQGAAQIRTERADLLGWAAVEHALTGPHKFLVGSVASRPAVGNVGRVYINTDINALQYDTGTAWVTLGGGATKAYVSNGSGIVLTGVLQDLLTTTINIVVGQWIIVVAMCNITFAGSSSPLGIDAKLKVAIDGTEIDVGSGTMEIQKPYSSASSNIELATIFAAYATATTGSHTLVFQGLAGVGVPTASHRKMLVVAM